MDLRPTDRRALGRRPAGGPAGRLDLTVIATILPGMVTDLRINAADVDRYVWIVNSYLLAYVVAIPGRRQALRYRRAGRLAFQGSLASSLSDRSSAHSRGDLPRHGRGAGHPGRGRRRTAAGDDGHGRRSPSPGRRAAALGLVGAVDTLGWVLGPIWGAMLVEVAPGQDPWRWVFIVNIPLAIAAAVAIGRARRSQTARRGVDQPVGCAGALLLAGTLLALNLGLSAGASSGRQREEPARSAARAIPLAELVLPLLVVAVVLGVLLVQRQRRAEWPLLPVTLFGDRQFSAAIVANFLVGASLIVAMVDIPVITAMLVDQASVSRVSALMLAPFTVLIALLSLAGGRIVSQVGFRLTASIGLVLVAIGYAALWLGLRGGVLIGMVPGLVWLEPASVWCSRRSAPPRSTPRRIPIGASPPP